ncbi:MAG: restriction endonuclease [Clostridiales bacterium]|nr:restriction endonuclease [Clostridiales bacterium]
MDTSLDCSLANRYKSKAQIARVLTETWTSEHMYCPLCGWPAITKFPNNRAVADFYCPNCKNQFEQKSKNGPFGAKIADGAYSTFIQRINSNDNPDFLLMSYSLEKMTVESMVFVPKFFFVPELVEKRKPLSENARRAGWVGCNILFEKIPIQGRISIIENQIPLDKDDVLHRVSQAQKIRTNDISARGWLLDTLNCVNSIESNVFTLKMVYQFEEELAAKHPNNHNIRAKLRQQLQQLRDRGVIAFLGNGYYRKNI